MYIFVYITQVCKYIFDQMPQLVSDGNGSSPPSEGCDQMPQLVSDGNGSSPPSEGGGVSGGFGGGGLPRQQA